MNNPIVSIIMCYRFRVDENRHSIRKFIESIDKYFPDKEKIEILIKLDNDDNYGRQVISELITDTAKDPLIKRRWIRTFLSNRWEGRWSINYAYEYMFPYRNPNSKFLLFAGDDIYFIRNVMEDIEKHINEEYRILGDYKTVFTPQKYDIVRDYHSEDWTIRKTFKDLGETQFICSYPIVSTKLVEIIGNLGHTPNMDSALGLLNLIVYKKYKISLAKYIPEFLIRNNVEQWINGVNMINDYSRGFNHTNCITDNYLQASSYYFKLMEQSARNIYLNMKEDNVLDCYKIE